MRSQTSSAAAGVVIARGSSRAERRVALAREDERQRHRPVEQVGAAVLARALGGPGDVEHVVEQLEGEPDARGRTPPSSATRAPAAPARRARTPPRTGARSSARSAAGSARRSIVGVPRVRALQQLARGRAPSRRARATRTASARPSAASSAKARENSRSPVAVAMSRARRRRRPSGAPRRRPARVEHVVVDERRAVHELDRGARRGRARRAASSPAARPRAARAAGAAACRRRRSSRRRARASTAPWPAAQLAPGAPRRAPAGRARARPPARDRRSAVSGVAGSRLAPRVERDDAARGEDVADVVEARGVHAAARARAGRGSA